jgi:hypothetical protein
MKLYDPKATCVKCGGEDVTSSYHKKNEYGCSVIGDDAPCNKIQKEHIVRSCTRCYYEWLEAPLQPKGDDE